MGVCKQLVNKADDRVFDGTYKLNEFQPQTLNVGPCVLEHGFVLFPYLYDDISSLVLWVNFDGGKAIAWADGPVKVEQIRHPAYVNVRGRRALAWYQWQE